VKTTSKPEPEVPVGTNRDTKKGPKTGLKSEADRMFAVSTDARITGPFRPEPESTREKRHAPHDPDLHRNVTALPFLQFREGQSDRVLHHGAVVGVDHQPRSLADRP
jgi:hypothetical protein